MPSADIFVWSNSDIGAWACHVRAGELDETLSGAGYIATSEAIHRLALKKALSRLKEPAFLNVYHYPGRVATAQSVLPARFDPRSLSEWHSPDDRSPEMRALAARARAHSGSLC